MENGMDGWGAILEGVSSAWGDCKMARAFLFEGGGSWRIGNCRMKTVKIESQ